MQTSSPRVAANVTSSGRRALSQAVTALLCLGICGNAFALAVLAPQTAPQEPPTQPENQQQTGNQQTGGGQTGGAQTGRTVIYRGTAPPDKPDLPPGELSDVPPLSAAAEALRQSATAGELSLDELAFSMSALSAAEARHSNASPSAADANRTFAWISPWLAAAKNPQLASAPLDDKVATVVGTFLEARGAFLQARDSAEAASVKTAGAALADATIQLDAALRNAHTAGKATPGQLVLGLNWILESRLQLIEAQQADAASQSGEIAQTGALLEQMAEMYRIEQAGADSPARMKARYYFSRAQEQTARLAGNRELAGFAAKHAMQHALARYAYVLQSRGMSEQDLFEVAEAARNRAESLARYADIRGDAVTRERADAEYQASLALLQAESDRRQDSPRKQAVARMLANLARMPLR